MLAEQLDKQWRARKAAVPIDAMMTFAPEGLVLGAGTVLAPAEPGGERQTIRLDGREARLVALLCAAHLRPVATGALKHIRKAAERWSEGDTSLAQVHLALSRMDRLGDPAAAQRLFLADELLKAGTPPTALLRALNLDPSALEPLEKEYDPEQLRVPAGSGRPSGRWTSNGGGASDGSGTSEPAGGGEGQSATGAAADLRANLLPVKYDPRDNSAGKPRLELFQTPPEMVPPIVGRPWFLGLTGEQIGALALFTLRFAGPTAALGTIFIPFNKSLRQEGVIAGWPPIQYLWHSDERTLVFSYLGPNWRQITTTAELGKDGIFRDVDGKEIGRVLPGRGVVIDRSALLPQEARGEDEPTLCPRPVPDVPRGDRGVPFENYMKLLVNPGNPTPSGFGVRMTDPATGATAMFDDCQRRSRIFFDYKGVTYAKLLGSSFSKSPMGKLVGEAERQVAAAPREHIVWVFAEKAAMDAVEEKFNGNDKLRNHIQFIYEPWPGSSI
jgi:hypothetical protein